jgi:hypothetical protein
MHPEATAERLGAFDAVPAPPRGVVPLVRLTLATGIPLDAAGA